MAADVGDLTREEARPADGGAREAGERQGSGERLGWLGNWSAAEGRGRTHAAREMENRDPPRMLEIHLEC
jgi:hypothetical protein